MPWLPFRCANILVEHFPLKRGMGGLGQMIMGILPVMHQSNAEVLGCRRLSIVHVVLSSLRLLMVCF